MTAKDLRDCLSQYDDDTPVTIKLYDKTNVPLNRPEHYMLMGVSLEHDEFGPYVVLDPYERHEHFGFIRGYKSINEYWKCLFDMAYDISHAAHKCQFDKGGNPYTSHVDTVCVNSTAQSPGNFIVAIVAQLHDVVEDTYIPLDFIESIFGRYPIGEAVDAITRRKDETYMDYIRRCKQNDVARLVKIEDLKHNMQLDRIPNPTEADYRRVKKYAKALKILEDNTDASNEM